MLRAQDRRTAASRSDARELWEYGDDRRLRTAHQDRRRRRALPGPGRRPVRARSLQPAAPAGSTYAATVEALPPRLRIGFSPDLGYAVVQSGRLGRRRGRRARPRAPRALASCPSPAGLRSRDAPGDCSALSCSDRGCARRLDGRAETWSAADCSSGFRMTEAMTPAQWAALGTLRVEGDRLVRRRLRSLRPARDADRPVRSLSRARPATRPRSEVRALNLVQRRVVHDPVQPVWHPAATVRGRPVAGWLADGRAARRAASPATISPSRRPAPSSGAALASALAARLVDPRSGLAAGAAVRLQARAARRQRIRETDA